MSDRDISSIRKQIESAETQDDYLAVNTLWLALLSMANLMPDRTERKRIVTLVDKIPVESTRDLLHDPGVDRLLALDPPIETILTSPHERLEHNAATKELNEIRSFRDSDSRKALMSLGSILKRIRNKREHAFKSPSNPRNLEILGAARSVLSHLTRLVLELFEV